MHLHVKFPRMHEMPIFTGIPVLTGKLSLFAYYLWLKWANFNVRMGCQFSQQDAHFFFKETGLCNSKGHKKIATYIKD